ncbi:hypothetical protein V2J52_13230 [Georgenia sp. MJ173]|uniref:hypothetical protein n=1 Tax=Georgenia sunbinii TaxID=3117728 RepID=UPI002F26D29C
MTPSAFFARSAAAARRTGDDAQMSLVPGAGDERRTAEPVDPAAAARAARLRAVDDAADSWRERLVALGGGSALWDVTLLGDAVIDLTAAHPSGTAQLYSGRPTRLSNLVREGESLVAARRGARTVTARTDELAQRYGVAPTCLAVGIATWTEMPPPAVVADDGSAGGETAPFTDGDSDAAPSTGEGGADSSAAADAAPAPGRPRTVRAPVLLRPVRVAPRAGQVADFDVQLEPTVDINQVLLRALRAKGATVDAAALTASTTTSGGFSPRAALSRLALLGSDHLADFEIEERTVIGPFVHPGQVLADDLHAIYDDLADHDVVAALAGDPAAIAALDQALPERVGADRPPQLERGVGDLDPDQQQVIDAVATGTSLFVDAPPGADVPATLAAVVADAVASGRRVLYVPGTRRVGRAVVGALGSLGLEDLVLDLSTDPQWRRTAPEQLRAGLAATEPPAQLESVRAIRKDLVANRERLAAYVAALHTEREPWGCSAHAALQALAGLTAARPGPRTDVRLAPAVVGALVAERRDHARERLLRAGSLGAYELRPRDTPWFGARLDSAGSAHAALERTQRLGEVSLPRLADDVARVALQTGLTTASTVEDWLEQLRMLDGVRGALDVFVPQIFERSAADMVIATSTRAWRKEHGLTMAGSTRRRLRKQAKDLLRPGRPVDDLHAELVRVQEQREIWRRHCPSGGWPQLPDGMAEMERHASKVRADLDALQPVIGSGAGKDDLFSLPLDRLVELMVALGGDGEALRLMPERSAVLAELESLGLTELVADLTERRVPAALVPAEFDLAWWSSVLEEMIRTDPAMAGYDGPVLVALAEEFRRLDAEQVSTLTAPVRRAVVRRLAAEMRSHREGASQLDSELAAGSGADLRQIYARHPRLVGAIRPAWAVPPVLVPQLLPAGPGADLVILDGVHHLPVEQAVGAIARARQVVLVGDSRRASGGIVGALAPLLPSLTLPTDRAEREEAIAGFLAAHGYSDVIAPVPAPPSPAQMRLHVIAGSGMPAPGADAVESVQVEVDHVVDLVIEHALATPDTSLAVVALNARHADRVREAILSAVLGSPSVAKFFDAARPEPFVVVDADGAAGLRRDSIVLSLGYAKTPHGRVLHNFGAISGPDGLACLVDALDAVREQLTVVSCIGPGEIDRTRLHQPGPVLLADLIDWAARQDATPDGPSSVAADPDPLLVDLAERLWRLGLTVVPRYGQDGGVRVPLAIGHPDLPGELVVAVLTDDADYVSEPNLRRRDRHWVQRLVARGWRVHMAHSTAVFTDPQGEAEAILALVLEVVDTRRLAENPVTLGTVALPPLELEDDDATPDDATPDDATTDDATTDGATADGTATGGPPVDRGPRPPVESGRPLGGYSDGELDELAGWLDADGTERDDAELVELLRRELGLRRGSDVDSVLATVAARRRR